VRGISKESTASLTGSEYSGGHWPRWPFHERMSNKKRIVPVFDCPEYQPEDSHEGVGEQRQSSRSSFGQILQRLSFRSSVGSSKGSLPNLVSTAQSPVSDHDRAHKDVRGRSKESVSSIVSSNSKESCEPEKTLESIDEEISHARGHGKKTGSTVHVRSKESCERVQTLD